MSNWRIARRYQVLGAMAGTGAVTWVLGFWAAGAAARAELQASGNPIHATLTGYGLGLQVTWAWLAGVVLLHAIVGALAWRRSDREAGIGCAWSAFFHLAWMVSQGALAPAGVG